MARYIRIKHKGTGQEVTLDTRYTEARRLGMGFLNKAKGRLGIFKHITLTQDIEHYHPNIVNNFFNRVRKFYGDVCYFWTTEIQEERAEKTGDRVIHWHVMIHFPGMKAYEFGRMDVLRLQGYWKYGNPKNSVHIAPLYKPNLGYLLKYVTKSLGVSLEGEHRIRRYGSSRIEGHFRQSFARLQRAIEHIGDYVRTLYWDYKGAFGYAYEEGLPGRQKKYIYTHPPSDWFSVERFDEGDTFYVDEPLALCGA